MTTITVTVSPQGETLVSTHGFAGNTCQNATRSLEAALGLKDHEQLTSEFFAAVNTEEVQQTY